MTDDDTISPTMHTFLDVIAKPESSGRYDVRYNGGTPAYFSDFSKHPDVHAPIPGTDMTSSAAGRYQFITPTWNTTAKMLGLKDFSPASQDQGAAFLANRTYKSATGRDLETDLGDPTRYGTIADTLHSQWPSITPQNIAMGFGKPPTTLVAQAAPAAQVSAPMPSAQTQYQPAQFQPQDQRLALLNRLMPQQTTQPYATVTNGDWTSALARPNTQTASYNPLLVLQRLAALKALNGDQSNSLLS